MFFTCPTNQFLYNAKIIRFIIYFIRFSDSILYSIAHHTKRTKLNYTLIISFYLLLLLLLRCEHQDFLIKRKLTIVIIWSIRRRRKQKENRLEVKICNYWRKSFDNREKIKRKMTFIRLSLKMDRNKKKTRKGLMEN